MGGRGERGRAEGESGGAMYGTRYKNWVGEGESEP